MRVAAPTPNAAMSVTLVTVMERPAWARVSPSRLSLERPGLEARLFQHWVMTNLKQTLSNSNPTDDAHLHVIDADAKAEEGKNGVERSHWKSQSRAESKSDHQSEENGKESGQGEVEPETGPADGAQDEDSVDSHQEVSSSHQTRVEENCRG